MDSEYNRIIKKLKNLERTKRRLNRVREQLEVPYLVECVNRDGIVFISQEFCDDFKIKNVPGLKILSGEYHVPVVNGKVLRNKAFIMVGDTKYNVVQLAYLQNWTDKEILRECEIDDTVVLPA